MQDLNNILDLELRLSYSMANYSRIEQKVSILPSLLEDTDHPSHHSLAIQKSCDIHVFSEHVYLKYFLGLELRFNFSKALLHISKMVQLYTFGQNETGHPNKNPLPG